MAFLGTLMREEAGVSGSICVRLSMETSDPARLKSLRSILDYVAAGLSLLFFFLNGKCIKEFRG